MLDFSSFQSALDVALSTLYDRTSATPTSAALIWPNFAVPAPCRLVALTGPDCQRALIARFPPLIVRTRPSARRLTLAQMQRPISVSPCVTALSVPSDPTQARQPSQATGRDRDGCDGAAGRRIRRQSRRGARIRQLGRRQPAPRDRSRPRDGPGGCWYLLGCRPSGVAGCQPRVHGSASACDLVRTRVTDIAAAACDRRHR